MATFGEDYIRSISSLVRHFVSRWAVYVTRTTFQATVAPVSSGIPAS